MGNSINLTETLIIALGALAAVFAILVLYAISMISKLTQMLIDARLVNTTGQSTIQNFSSNAVPQSPVQSIVDSNDEEDKLVAALAATIVATNDNPGSNYQVSKITRIK